MVEMGGTVPRDGRAYALYLISCGWRAMEGWREGVREGGREGTREGEEEGGRDRGRRGISPCTSHMHIRSAKDVQRSQVHCSEILSAG